MAEPPPIPSGAPTVIPYATPQYALPPGQIARWGNQLIVPRYCYLPNVCVKCNQPAGKYRWQRHLYWHHPALYILILFPGILIYIIVAMIVRRSCLVEASLCDFHGRRRRRRIWIGWLIALTGVLSFIAAFVLASGRQSDDSPLLPILIVLGTLLVIVSLFWAIFAVRVLWPKAIDRTHAHLAGAGAEFLDSLPSA